MSRSKRLVGLLAVAATRIENGRDKEHNRVKHDSTVQATINHVKLAMEAGVEIVNVYGPAAWHGFRPTADEFTAYFDELLTVIRHPVALEPSPGIGYSTTPAAIADICNRYAQVVAMNLRGVPDTYLIELKDMIRRDIASSLMPELPAISDRDFQVSR